ncbi:MAG: START-like domain-containing protein [Saprospiraceae bacterium]
MKRVSIELEFLFKASPAILYQFLTQPSNLVRWFCDKADVEEEVFTFTWKGYSETAELVDDIEEERLRFHWTDAPKTEYLEYRMFHADITNETILQITDFCDELDAKDQRALWTSQIKQLRIEIGG